MAEKRKPCASICVKTGAKTTAKIELFPAEQWLKSAQGRFRLRINRKWHNDADGSALYFLPEQINAVAAGHAVGEAPALEAEPDLPVGTPVAAPNGRTLAGNVMYDVTRTATAPMRGYDGRWYVGVTIIGRGCVLLPVGDLKRKG